MATAFTLVELLVVIFIITLLVTLALPAFNLISGSKSIAGAENEISSLLGRARADAVGVQDYRGLAIYRDAVTDRYSGAIVAPVVAGFGSYQTWSGTSGYSQYAYVQYNGISYVSLTNITAPTSPATNPAPPTVLNVVWSQCGPNAVDIQSNTDVEVFPLGVGVQVINNCGMNGTSRTTNGYLPIGIILFNGSGQMQTNKPVTLAEYGQLGVIGTFSAYGQNSIPYYGTPATANAPHNGIDLYPSLGLVAFDKNTFDAQGFFPLTQLPWQLSTTAANGSIDTGYSGSADNSADTWLDNNATPLLINRYNGTLVRSE